MFTGIVQALCPITDLKRAPGLVTLTLKLPPELFKRPLERGASIAISGVCLTVTEFNDAGHVAFDIMQETLEKTTLHGLRVGQRVNVERSALMSSEIGGHIVSGHITTTAEIVHVDNPENNHAVTFRVDPIWMKYILPKGFVALDGASLTIVDTDPQAGTFSVWFIPETLRQTAFGLKTVGDSINVEIESRTQSIVDTVERVLAQRAFPAQPTSSDHKDPASAMTDTKNIAIVAGSYHRTKVEEMLDAARSTAAQHNITISDVIWVHGSLEKPLAVKKLLQRDSIDGVVTLGIIERGETKHGRVMGQASINALIDLQLEFEKPVGVGILGPGILPSQIPSRLRPYASEAVIAIAGMFASGLLD